MRCGSKRDTDKFRASFAVFNKMVRYDTKDKRLNLCLGRFRCDSVREKPTEINDFCDPATVFLLFNFHAQVQMTNITPLRST
jgi:hypothetical protein